MKTIVKPKVKPKSKAKPKSREEWQLQEAKAMFSEVVKKAVKTPQFVTIHGEKKAVVMSYDEYINLTVPKMSLVELIQNSPFYGVELELPPRIARPPREINL